MTRAFALLAVLLVGSCQSVRDDSNFPTLHPRDRALYTTILLEPGEQKLELAGLTRQLQEQSFTLTGPSGELPVVVRLRADREAESLYTGTLTLAAADGSWEVIHRLPPRSSGRWQIDLAPTTGDHGFTGMRVEIEPDPYWEMEQQRPPGLPRAFGR